jgi:hypothetical protein
VAVLLASSIMFGRVVVEVALLFPSLLNHLAWPLGVMGLTGVAIAGFLYWRSKRSPPPEGEVELSNPFELSTALKFALLFAVVLLASKAAATYLGNRGIYLAAVLAGLTDVDAVTLSMVNLARSGQLSSEAATTSIFLGAVANTVTKGALACIAGSWAFGKKVIGALGVVLASGVVTLGIAQKVPDFTLMPLSPREWHSVRLECRPAGRSRERGATGQSSQPGRAEWLAVGASLSTTPALSPVEGCRRCRTLNTPVTLASRAARRQNRSPRVA